MVLGDKENYLLIFAVDGVALDMSSPIWSTVTAHDSQLSHRLGKIVPSLIDFVFSDFTLMIIFEFEKNHASSQFPVKLSPAVAVFEVPVREHGISAVDSRVGSRLYMWSGQRRYEEKTQRFGADVFELPPAVEARTAVLEPSPKIIRCSHVESAEGK
jgi:hypothetical protein